MMVIKSIVRAVVGAFRKIEGWSREEKQKIYLEAAETPEKAEEFHSVWGYLKFRENTQAFHLASVLGFEEWVDMAEIRRRVKEIFGVEYRNERSLYPYLKTLVDVGLMENSNVGGRRQWRKSELFVGVPAKEKGGGLQGPQKTGQGGSQTARAGAEREGEREKIRAKNREKEGKDEEN